MAPQAGQLIFVLIEDGAWRSSRDTALFLTSSSTAVTLDVTTLLSRRVVEIAQLPVRHAFPAQH